MKSKVTHLNTLGKLTDSFLKSIHLLIFLVNIVVVPLPQLLQSYFVPLH